MDNDDPDHPHSKMNTQDKRLNDSDDIDLRGFYAAEFGLISIEELESGEYDVQREALMERVEEVHDRLQNGGEAIPDLELVLPRADFENLLTTALEGDFVTHEEGRLRLFLDDQIDFGYIVPTIDLIVHGSDDNAYQEQIPLHSKENTADTHAFHQASLFRDVNEQAGEISDMMKDVVDEREELYWGGEFVLERKEPGLDRAFDRYTFSTTIYLR